MELRALSGNKFFGIDRQVFKSEAFIVFAICAFGLLLRLIHFYGFGLGDDAAYLQRASFPEFFPSGQREFRPSFEWPMFLFMKIFGINDFGFVFYSLIISIANIYLVFRLTQYISKNLLTASLAALLLAVSTYDIVYSSAIVIDIYVAFGSLAALLCFLKGLDAQDKKSKILHFLWTIFFLFYLYYVKIPSVFMVVVLAVVGIIYAHRKKDVFIFLAIFAAAFLALQIFEALVFKGFLGHLKVNLGPHGRYPLEILWSYIHWMFYWLPNGEGYMFGWYFYLGIPALVLAMFTNKRSYIPLLWFVLYFLFLQFFPVSLSPYSPMPRFPRYTYILLPPLIMSAASVFSWLMSKKIALKVLSIVIFLSFSAVSIFFASEHYGKVKDARKDLELASEFLAKRMANEPRPVVADNFFIDYFNFYTSNKYLGYLSFALDGRSIWETPYQDRFDKLTRETAAYTVVGGSRYHWMSFMHQLDQIGHAVPDHWQRLTTIDASPYNPVSKSEALKIYRVDEMQALANNKKDFLFSDPAIKSGIRKKLLIDQYHGRSSNEFVKFLREQGYEATEVYDRLDDTILAQNSCIVLTFITGIPDYSSQELAALKKFFDQGGRILSLAIAWNYDYYPSGEFPYNRLLSYFNMQYSRNTSVSDRVEVSGLSNIVEGIEKVDLEKMIWSTLVSLDSGYRNQVLLVDSNRSPVAYAGIKADARVVALGHCNFGYLDFARPANQRLIENALQFLTRD